MDSHDVVVELRQAIMEKLAKSFRKIADAVSPNVVVSVHWSLNDPIDIPKMPDAEAEPDLKIRKAPKEKKKSKAEKKAFYMCNYWRKKKGLAPLSLEAWKAEKSGKPAVKEAPEKN